MLSRSTPLVTLFSALVILPSTLRAQTDCGNNPGGDIGSSQSSILSTGNFCDANIAGSDACYEGVSKVAHNLRLDAGEGVDITCETDAGTICIMKAGCKVRIDDQAQPHKVRLRSAGGLLPTQLRVVIADNEANDEICGRDDFAPTITCTGNFGNSPVIFRSEFEDDDPREFADWFDFHCPDCRVASGKLSAGGSAALPGDEGFDAPGRDRHTAFLQSDVDFRLELQWWDDQEWIPVASAAPGETLEFDGLPGRYRWRVHAGERGGAYALWTAGGARDR